MKKAEANLITGGLSAPSKMPCKGFSIPASTCNVGTMLRKVPGSTCSACYALKGRYMFPNVQRALQRRLDALQVALAGGPGSILWGRWLDAMGTLIGSDRFFRFHDSGDLQSVLHLELYCYLAEEKTGCRFWLPTRESATLRRHGRHIPANLLVRFSGPMLNRPAKLTIDGRKWSHYSEVWTRDQVATDAPAPRGFSVNGRWVCTAPTTGGKCADCRACWDPKIPTVIYIKH